MSRDYLSRDFFKTDAFRPFVRRTVRQRKVMWGVYQRHPNRYEECAGLFLEREQAKQYALTLRKQ